MCGTFKQIPVLGGPERADRPKPVTPLSQKDPLS